MRDVARIAAADLKKDCYGALRLKQFCRFDHNNQSLTQFKKRIHSNKKTSLVANEGDGLQWRMRNVWWVSKVKLSLKETDYRWKLIESYHGSEDLSSLSVRSPATFMNIPNHKNQLAIVLHKSLRIPVAKTKKEVRTRTEQTRVQEWIRIQTYKLKLTLNSFWFIIGPFSPMSSHRSHLVTRCWKQTRTIWGTCLRYFEASMQNSLHRRILNSPPQYPPC